MLTDVISFHANHSLYMRRSEAYLSGLWELMGVLALTPW
jgi:hypothetical protein